MNFDLTEEQELVRSTVRDFAEQKVAPVAEELDREHRFPYELVSDLAELGLMPYRLVRAFADDLKAEERPVVTICTTGSRATTAASVLTAAGVDARPVLGEGVEDWAEHGGQTVHFRRCGN